MRKVERERERERELNRVCMRKVERERESKRMFVRERGGEQREKEIEGVR